MAKKTTRIMTMTAVLAAVSIVLSYFEIPIIPAFPFLKLDFAEVPIILCALFLGPVPAITAEGIRNLFALLLTGTATLGIGTLANFILGTLFVLALHLYVRNTNHKYNRFVGLLAASIFITLAASILNLVLFVPLYQMVGMFPQGVAPIYFVIAGILPLNLIKWPLLSIISAVIFRYTEKYFKLY